MPIFVSRGEIWIVDLAPVAGHEQGGEPRPCVIVSASEMDTEATGMAIVVPSTRTKYCNKAGELKPSHYEVDPSKDNGLTSRSYFMCEQVRAVSTSRFGQRKIGRLTQQDMYQIEERLIILMDLGA